MLTIAQNCLTSHLRKKTAQPIGAREPVAAGDGDGELTDDKRTRWLQECLEILDENWAHMEGVYRILAASQNGFEVLASANEFLLNEFAVIE